MLKCIQHFTQQKDLAVILKCMKAYGGPVVHTTQQNEKSKHKFTTKWN